MSEMKSIRYHNEKESIKKKYGIDPIDEKVNSLIEQHKFAREALKEQVTKQVQEFPRMTRITIFKDEGVTTARSEAFQLLDRVNINLSGGLGRAEEFHDGEKYYNNHDENALRDGKLRVVIRRCYISDDLDRVRKDFSSLVSETLGFFPDKVFIKYKEYKFDQGVDVMYQENFIEVLDEKDYAKIIELKKSDGSGNLFRTG